MARCHEIIRQARGKTTVEDRGSLDKMNDRLKQLRSSTTGGKVSGRGHHKYRVVYSIRECPDDLTADDRKNPPNPRHN